MATTQTASAPVMPGGLDSKKGPGAVPSGQAAPKAVPVRSRMPGAGQFDAGTADTLERIARGPVEPMPLSHYALMKRNEYLLQNISQRRLGEMDFNAPDPNKPQAKPKPTLKPLAHSF